MPMEINPFEYLINANKRFFWFFLLSSLLISMVYLYIKPKALKVNLSKKLWLHPSAVLDYYYFFIAIIFKVVLIAPFIIGAQSIALFVNNMLMEQYGFVRITALSRHQIIILYTLSLFIVSDFTRYWLHRLLHQSSFLWQFHKTHHSAKVLTPFTFYRVHPVESFLFGWRYALSIGIVSGVFLFYFGALIGIYDVLGVNIFVFIFTSLGSNLRHSHIKLGFGNIIESIIISPYQHQIHHSTQHLDTNFGGFLAIWDWLFGTLTRSQNTKTIKFGLQPKDMKNFSRLSNLITTPFLSIFTQPKKDIK
jgi:sterol desaturase/sphingolipid hydroxylase (fatty acid hydroxylase superfamily)